MAAVIGLTVPQGNVASSSQEDVQERWANRKLPSAASHYWEWVTTAGETQHRPHLAAVLSCDVQVIG